MPDNQDHSDLQLFAESGSEEAFARIVKGHIDLVYSAAMRQTGDAHMAHDVTQAVFMILARKAHGLSPKVVLAGWLVRTTRFVSSDALKKLRRQRVHERKAASMRPTETADSQASSEVNDLIPLLDSSLATLSQRDRDALALRYLEQLSLREVAGQLGISEEAAKKRVSRALERLRRKFARQGLTITALALAAALPALPTTAAPSSLTASTVSGAVAASKGAFITGSAAVLAKGASVAMFWASAKPVAVAVVALSLVAGGGYTAVRMSSVPEPIVTVVASDVLAVPSQGVELPRESNLNNDYQLMLDELGIDALRFGVDPQNPATYDEGVANTLLDTLPDVLTMEDGRRVVDASQWGDRRAEIVERFEESVYGRIPANTPQVHWEVIAQTTQTIGGIPTVTNHLVGHADDPAYPELSVNIRVSYTLAVETTSPRPLVMMIDGRALSNNANPLAAPPRWAQQAIENGWAFGFIDPSSIQPDNSQLLRAGIIGLTNRGKARTPGQWGAMRAWQWGISRLIDHFERAQGTGVDASRFTIAGLSRYGKAALVAQAFEPRIAAGLTGSSGAGGTKLHRRLYGETIENLAMPQMYHWFAGNFLRYSAALPVEMNQTVADMPVDSHQLIALCAPRPCFISYGSPMGGEAEWVDARGSYMAGVLASDVYGLLGGEGFGGSEGLMYQQMPAVNSLVGDDLAWRQHISGHTLAPTWPVFFDWANRHLNHDARASNGAE